MGSETHSVSQNSNFRGKFTSEVEEVTRALYRAYEKKDLVAAQNLVAKKFNFTSSLDNHLDRDAYFKTCWPNSKFLIRFYFQQLLIQDNKAFVVYEATTKINRFRNTEILTVENGKVTAVEVYFGWDIPHPVPSGGHSDNVLMF